MSPRSCTLGFHMCSHVRYGCRWRQGSCYICCHCSWNCSHVRSEVLYFIALTVHRMRRLAARFDRAVYIPRANWNKHIVYTKLTIYIDNVIYTGDQFIIYDLFWIKGYLLLLGSVSIMTEEFVPTQNTSCRLWQHLVPGLLDGLTAAEMLYRDSWGN